MAFSSKVLPFSSGSYEVFVLAKTVSKSNDNCSQEISASSSMEILSPSIYGNSRVIFETNVDDDYINFGSTYTAVDGADGTTFSDTYGTSYSLDFILGAYNGSSGGSAVSIGSIEYVYDGTNEVQMKALIDDVKVLMAEYKRPKKED